MIGGGMILSMVVVGLVAMYYMGTVVAPAVYVAGATSTKLGIVLVFVYGVAATLVPFAVMGLADNNVPGRVVAVIAIMLSPYSLLYLAYRRNRYASIEAKATGGAIASHWKAEQAQMKADASMRRRQEHFDAYGVWLEEIR